MHTADKAALCFWLSGGGYDGKRSMMVEVRLDYGEQRCWFTLEEREISMMQKGGTAQDLMRRVEFRGDMTMVYNIEGLSCSGADHGRREVRYDRLWVPTIVWELLLRYARLARRAIERRADEDGVIKYDDRRVVVELSKERRERWARLYGQGKGKLKVEHLGEAAVRMTAWAAGDATGECARLVEHVGCIALNSTWFFHQEARVRWCCDGADLLYWEVFGADGRRRMNGGLLRSEDGDGKVSYSLHT